MVWMLEGLNNDYCASFFGNSVIIQ
uniref:Uncharacterized protein n=1 Tax=Rhizophora mucronata TaxID=61149 RepID=A0A2P2QAA0_RHIMU